MSLYAYINQTDAYSPVWNPNVHSVKVCLTVKTWRQRIKTNVFSMNLRDIYILPIVHFINQIKTTKQQ